MSVKKRATLLLEDDPVQVMLFQSMLSGVHDEVYGSDNVADALRILKESEISACVVDLGVYRQFQDYDPSAGIGFIAKARKIVGDAVPILVVTGARDPSVLVPCFQAGCDDYVTKADGVEGAVARLKRWLGALPISEEHMRGKRAAVLSSLKDMA